MFTVFRPRVRSQCVDPVNIHTLGSAPVTRMCDPVWFERLSGLSDFQRSCRSRELAEHRGAEIGFLDKRVPEGVPGEGEGG